MVAHVSGERMKLPLVPIAAVTFGGIFALSAAAVPASFLDSLLSDGDLAGWIPLAETGRPLFALATGAIGSGAGALAAMLVAPRRVAAVPLPYDDERMPVIRRADALPDAPLHAGHAPDLAVPATAPTVDIAERDLPVDLDQPLAAFDPQAIPPVPLPPPVPPRREGRTSSVARASQGRDGADRLVRPETDATVHALLERLERGVVRRNEVAQARGKARPERSMDDALAALRNLARQA